MSFDLNKMKSIALEINATTINLDAWVRDQSKFTGIATPMTIRTGAMSLTIDMNEERANQLIANLYQHIQNIKACEIDLLALQTKAAA